MQSVRAKSRRWGQLTSRAVRFLALHPRPITQVELATELGTSQARISQILKLLEVEGIRTSDLTQYDQRALMIDLYVRHFRPTVNTETLWYGLDAHHLQVEKVSHFLATCHARFVVSADAAPDFLAPWRSPTLTAIYCAEAPDLASVGCVPAMARGEATLIVRETPDSYLLEPWASRNETPFPMAHPLQQIWDLYDLGGADRIEAAERLMRRIVMTSDASPVAPR